MSGGLRRLHGLFAVAPVASMIAFTSLFSAPIWPTMRATSSR